MFESQREPVPFNDAGETDTALAFLSFSRACVLKKLDGLDEEQLRRRLVASGTTLLGLVQHLTGAERYWFGYTVAGETTRHAGHADILRELIDGVTGR